ncbi:MAG: hypothetical protein JO222_12505 [Frankiales bacterium]|nr:hypothetical protein [Frankiales bacterium]
MIFALNHPVELAGLLIGFVVGMLARGGVQQAVVSRSRRRSSVRSLSTGGRGPRVSGQWSTYLDPYGTVGAIIAGVGWSPRREPRRGTFDDVALLVAALVVHAVLAAAGLAALSAAGVPLSDLHGLAVSSVLHGDLAPSKAGQALALGFAMVNIACGLLALFPLPPLELGVVLWSRLPRTPGARRFAYHLLEEQWGVAVVLVLLLLPLGGQQPLLLVLINDAAGPILRAL